MFSFVVLYVYIYHYVNCLVCKLTETHRNWTIYFMRTHQLSITYNLNNRENYTDSSVVVELTKHSVDRESWQMTTSHRRSCHWSSRAEPAPTRSLRPDPAWTPGGSHTCRDTTEHWETCSTEKTNTNSHKHNILLLAVSSTLTGVFHIHHWDVLHTKMSARLLLDKGILFSFFLEGDRTVIQAQSTLASAQISIWTVQWPTETCANPDCCWKKLFLVMSYLDTSVSTLRQTLRQTQRQVRLHRLCCLCCSC